jgi:hypothetical protein
MRISLASAFFFCLTNLTFADTVSLKCSFVGLWKQEVLYVINSVTQEVTVVGDFGTHKAKLLTYDEGEGFYFILEPNRGASVSTLIYIKAGETPVGIRSTLGLLRPNQYQGIPDGLKLAADTRSILRTNLESLSTGRTST